MLEYVGIRKQLEFFVVWVTYCHVIAFSGKCLYRMQVLPVGSQKEMLPAILAFPTHEYTSVSRYAPRVLYTGLFKVFRKTFCMFKRNTAVPGSYNH
ncbi:Uncharacterised protein [Serratia quinivorans]|nr:Uncharacterised protein [Serratia quinivorans]